MQDRVAVRAASLTKAQMSTIPMEYIMKEMSNIIPQNVVLDSLGVDQKGKTLDMIGVVYGPRSLAEDVLTKFMEALEQSKYFKDAQLASIQDKIVDREEVAGFEITCSLD